MGGESWFARWLRRRREEQARQDAFFAELEGEIMDAYLEGGERARETDEALWEQHRLERRFRIGAMAYLLIFGVSVVVLIVAFWLFGTWVNDLKGE